MARSPKKAGDRDAARAWYEKAAKLGDAADASVPLNLPGAILTGAYLRDAILKGAYLEGANLDGANLIVANLKGVVALTPISTETIEKGSSDVQT